MKSILRRQALCAADSTYYCLARLGRLHAGIQQGEVDPSDRHQVQLAEMRERHPHAVLVIGEPAQQPRTMKSSSTCG